MAAKKRSTKAKEGPLSKEERAVLMMYRMLSRWEKNCFHILMGGLAWGQLVKEKTDQLPWESIRRLYALPAEGKKVAHG